jgi:DNA-binding transcriptional MocR family regulator
VARYLQIGTEMAQRVRSGEFPAGTELPTIREYAHKQRTTTSTIGRAYHPRNLGNRTVPDTPEDHRTTPRSTGTR